MCKSPPETGRVGLAGQHVKGSVQVARPPQRSANLRSQLDVGHDPGRQVAIQRAPHLRSQSSTPVSAPTAPRSGRRLPQGSGRRDARHRARHRARHSAHKDSASEIVYRAWGCSSRLPLTGHPSPDTPVSTPQARVQRRRWAGDRDGRPRPRRVVVYRPRSKLGAPCPYQSACSCLLRLGAGR